MSVDEHAPFRRGGGQVPVRYVVAPTEEPTPEPESPERSGLHRRIAVVTALALIASLVAAGQWFLGVEAEQHGPPLVAGLDEPPPVAPHQAVGAFLEAGSVDVSADVSLGTRAVTVRAAERSTGRLIWEQQVDPTHSVASLSLVEHRARGEVVVVMRRPWTTTEWRRTPGGPVFGEAEAPETSTVASLDLVTGERRRSAEWPAEAVAVSSSRGHLFRFDRAASVLSAMDDVETVSWDAPVEVGPTIAHIELREHAGWLLVMPSPGIVGSGSEDPTSSSSRSIPPPAIRRPGSTTRGAGTNAWCWGTPSSRPRWAAASGWCERGVGATVSACGSASRRT